MPYGEDESAYKDTVVTTIYVRAGNTQEARNRARDKAKSGARIGLAKQIGPGRFKVYVTYPKPKNSFGSSASPLNAEHWK